MADEKLQAVFGKERVSMFENEQAPRPAPEIK
jgi:hypothetical protein